MIVTADSVTELDDVSGMVLVAGSHGGTVAAYYAAAARVRAVIFHDAGLSKDDSGVAGLALLESAGIAAAAVRHSSARIGDGADCLARGTISRANAQAAACGVAPGQACSDAAVRLLAAPRVEASLPPAGQGRHALAPSVVGCDSVGQLQEGDAGRILVIGSHASLHGGREESALPIAAALVFFHHGGGDCSRLPVLDARGIPAAAVDAMSARIGNARSLWESGIVSNPNRTARAVGIVPGMTVRAAVQGFTAGQSG
ncbi:MAG TPA: hypothetical protein VEB41_11570 [Burkholderiales bacterium]|nr:hypothetical protein [Burkholderiales bacterium]